MKYFFDTEFIEDGKTIDLISIGIVCEDGREFHAVNIECDFLKADEWVAFNVLLPMGITLDRTASRFQMKDGMHPDAMSKVHIAKMVQQFVGYVKPDFFYPPQPINREEIPLEIVSDPPEFWADYCSYDWVVFCQLFGKMIDLPRGFPMYCNDIQQLWTLKGFPVLPKQQGTVHDALEDARYVKQLHSFLSSL